MRKSGTMEIQQRFTVEEVVGLLFDGSTELSRQEVQKLLEAWYGKDSPQAHDWEEETKAAAPVERTAIIWVEGKKSMLLIRTGDYRECDEVYLQAFMPAVQAELAKTLWDLFYTIREGALEASKEEWVQAVKEGCPVVMCGYKVT